MSIAAIDASAPSGLSLIWRNADLRPVGQPIAIGDVVVGIVVDDLKAYVVGIDRVAATMAAGAHLGNLAVIATRDGYLGFKAP